MALKTALLRRSQGAATRWWGAATPLLVPGKGEVEGIFLADRADVALTYCSGAPAVTREVPGLETVPLPLELTVGPALWHGPAQRPSTRRKSGEMARATALPYSSAYGPSRHSPDPG